MKTFLLLIITSTIIISQVGCAGVSHPAPPPSQLAFNSTPGAAASEGQPYSYSMTVTGAGQNAVTYHLLSGPSGASISGNALTWVPASDQARVANQFSVSATSGTSVVHQAWSVTPAGTVQGTMIVSYVNDSGTT
jgi:hypothetical protein